MQGAPSSQAPIPQPLSPAVLEGDEQQQQVTVPNDPSRAASRLPGATDHLPGGCPGEVRVTPPSQPLQGEALAEAHAKVTHGENLWGERRHFGKQP